MDYQRSIRDVFSNTEPAIVREALREIRDSAISNKRHVVREVSKVIYNELTRMHNSILDDFDTGHHEAPRFSAPVTLDDEDDEEDHDVRIKNVLYYSELQIRYHFGKARYRRISKALYRKGLDASTLSRQDRTLLLQVIQDVREKPTDYWSHYRGINIIACEAREIQLERELSRDIDNAVTYKASELRLLYMIEKYCDDIVKEFSYAQYQRAFDALQNGINSRHLHAGVGEVILDLILRARREKDSYWIEDHDIDLLACNERERQIEKSIKLST